MDNRIAMRNVHIYDAKDRLNLLGGLRLNNGVTNSNLHSMLEICYHLDSGYSILDADGVVLQRNEEPLAVGNYYVFGEDSSDFSDARPPIPILIKQVSTGSYTRNEEKWLTRTPTRPSSGRRMNAFRDQVRQRDRGCVITGIPALGADIGYWKPFESRLSGTLDTARLFSVDFCSGC